MKIKTIVIVALAICLSSSLALADSFVGSGGGSWAAVVAPNQLGGEFWDNPSNDSTPPGNVGQILLSNDPGRGLPVQNLQYWSIGNAADNNVFFNGVGQGQTETLVITVAGNSGSNSLYAYDLANVGSTTLLFQNTSVVPPAAPVTVQKNIPYAQYGFMLTGPGGTFFSGSGHGEVTNPATDLVSNFAFFRNSQVAGTWYFGVEDLPNPITREGFGDYNDMVVKFSAVPLPGAVLLLGAGMARLAAYARRRREE
jgi:hypothetical protein